MTHQDPSVQARCEQKQVLEFFAELSEEMGMDEVADEMREHANEFSLSR